MAVEFILKVGTTKTNIVKVPAPTDYDIEYEDQSAPDAGRVESGRMNKKRKGTIRKASFQWKNLTDSECQQVFSAFQPEYIFAQILDPFQRAQTVEEFTVGNRKAHYSSINDGTWESVSLSITDRNLLKF